MTSDEEATADTARFLKPNLADEEVLKRAKSNVRSLRDCGAASAVGAGTVAVSLLIGAGNVALDAFYVLMAAQALLLWGAQFFDARSERFMPRDRSRKKSIPISGAPVIILGAGYYLTHQLRKHESNIGPASWWWLLGLAGAGALLGLFIRRSAESRLDELDDESWKQRVAPLVNEQQKAVGEMWSMGVLLSNALKATQPVPEQKTTSAAATRPAPAASGPSPPEPEHPANSPSDPLPSLPKARPGRMPRHKPSTETEHKYQADVALAVQRTELLDTPLEAEGRLRQAQVRRAPQAEIRRLAKDLDATLTAAMQAAYAAQRAEIGPRGYEDRIYRRKAKATPRVHALTAQAERLLTLRETHRINGIPAVTFEPSLPPSQSVMPETAETDPA